MREMFEKLADRTSKLAGTPLAFFTCCGSILIWAVAGPISHFSDTWQLTVNTGTTIITFLMVFLIQSTQNRDTKALHAKLDELLRTKRDANPDLIGIEREPERRTEATSEVTRRQAASSRNAS